MATFVIKVNGVAFDENDHPVEDFRISEVMNGIARCDFEIPVFVGDLVIALGDEIEVYEDGVLVFGGYIDEVNERTMDWQGTNVLAITATDFSQIGQFRLVNLTLAAGTLKDQLLQLEDPYLTDYGGSIDAAQPDGPTMAETPIVDLYMNEVFNLLAKNAPGFYRRVSYDKKFWMVASSSSPAPFDVTPSNVADKVLGDVRLQRRRTDSFANRVIIRSPPVERIEHHDTFPGDGVTDEFQLSAASIHRTYGYVDNDPNNHERLAIAPEIDAEWQIDLTTRKIKRLAGAPDLGNAIDFKYDGTFTGEAMAEDVGAQAPPTGIREILLTAPEGLSAAALQALADGELAWRVQDEAKSSYKTNEVGLHPGMTQGLEEVFHGIDGELLLTQVGHADEKLGGGLTRNVQGTLADRFQGTFHDKYTLWAKAGKGAAVAATEGFSPAGGPYPPNRVVQVYRDGAFYGTPNFLFDYDASGQDYKFGSLVGDKKAMLAVRTDDPDVAVQVWRNNNFTADYAFGLTISDAGAANFLNVNQITFHSNSSFFSATAKQMFFAGSATGKIEPFCWIEGNTILDGFMGRIDVDTNPVSPGSQASQGLTYIFDLSTSGNKTFALQDLDIGSSFANSVFGRLFLIKNEGTSGILTLDADSTEVLYYRNGTSVSTFAVGPGQAVLIQAQAGAGARKGWHILLTMGYGTVAGGVGDVQWNDSGVPGGDPSFKFDNTRGQVRIAADTNHSQLIVTNAGWQSSHGGDASDGAIALTPQTNEYNDLLIGGYTKDDGSGGRDYIPTSSILAYLWTNGGGSNRSAGIDLLYGETQGVASAFGNGVGFEILAGTDPDKAGLDVYEYGGLGTGAVPGMRVRIARNSSNNGAAGHLALEDKAGTPYYLWVEAGKLRIHTAPPTENNTTVSHTAGTVVGTQS